MTVAKEGRERRCPAFEDSEDGQMTSDSHKRKSHIMGATLGQVIRTVILPLSAGGIFSGSTIVFIYTIGFFITPAVLGGGKVNPLSIRIERTLSTFQDWGSASVLGILLLVLMALIGVMFLAAWRLMARNKAGAAHA